MSRESSQEESTSQHSEITIDDSPEVVLDRITVPEENKENRLMPKKPVLKGNKSSAVVVDDESKFLLGLMGFCYKYRAYRCHGDYMLNKRIIIRVHRHSYSNLWHFLTFVSD